MMERNTGKWETLREQLLSMAENSKGKLLLVGIGDARSIALLAELRAKGMDIVGSWEEEPAKGFEPVVKQEVFEIKAREIPIVEVTAIDPNWGRKAPVAKGGQVLSNKNLRRMQIKSRRKW